MPRREAYKVIVWGPGYTGLQAVREMLKRPEIEIVGCLAYSDSKAGQDLGELAGLQAIGVTITTDQQQILALDADIVVYTARAMPDEEVQNRELAALLASGKNVVASTAYFFPWQRGEDYAGTLEQACQQGGVTLHGTGVHPSWFMERFVLTLSGLCTRVNSLELREVVDLSHHSGAAIRGIGYGMKPERLGSKSRKYILSRYYFEAIASTAHSLGVRLDKMTANINYLTTDKRIELATMTIEPDTVSCVDGVWTAYADSKPFITLREFWYLDPEAVDFTDITSPDFYDVRISGTPVDINTRVDLSVTEASDIYGLDDQQCGANLTTAVQLVQTIPAVVEAEPGILVPKVFAYPAGDLRDAVDPMRRRPVKVPEEIE